MSSILPRKGKKPISDLTGLRFGRLTVADYIGCASSLIHKWERFKRVPSGFMLMCWIDALGFGLHVYKL
jgi:hypothetical protein